MGSSFLEGRSYIRGRVLNLNRLSRARKERSRPQPNLVFAQFSVVCMFNWMLGQLRRVIGRSYVRGRASNSIRAILSPVYVQLDARPIEEGCREVVCSWEVSNLN